MVVCVPSGNFGNLTAGLFAKKMGLPIKGFIAANNRNDVFYQYLKTGEYIPRPSVTTVANAMDVGDPSNFDRILDLYGDNYEEISSEIKGAFYLDDEIKNTILKVWNEYNYLLDPHGACGYQALVDLLKEDEQGVFLETAHPAKFLETVEPIIEEKIEVPDKLQSFMKGEKQSLSMDKEYKSFRTYLLALE